ncbi:MAG: ABC transporter ATP-binding protein [Gammaproteobacteria bacterium]|nr:ABC transporter ATP-binding protein [Gammaproteobacteria bacterium]
MDTSASTAAPLLVATDLQIDAGARTLVRALSFELRAGEFLAVLGRNGSGKSLTLHTLAGLRRPATGTLRCGTRPITELGRRATARHIGLLPQDREDALPLTALESALVGRHPHLRTWQSTGALDEALALRALERFGVGAQAARAVSTLSGGEQRRAAMAALLTQQPHVYLLDEPTNHLDPHHQIEVLGVFRELCHAGAAVIATLHDPALAERYSDRTLLLFGDGRWRLGPSREVLSVEELSALYLTPMTALGTPGRRAFIVA